MHSTVSRSYCMEGIQSHTQPRSLRQMHVGADRLTRGTQKIGRHGSISLLVPMLDTREDLPADAEAIENSHHNPAPDRRQDGICLLVVRVFYCALGAMHDSLSCPQSCHHAHCLFAKLLSDIYHSILHPQRLNCCTRRCENDSHIITCPATRLHVVSRVTRNNSRKTRAVNPTENYPTAVYPTRGCPTGGYPIGCLSYGKLLFIL